MPSPSSTKYRLRCTTCAPVVASPIRPTTAGFPHTCVYATQPSLSSHRPRPGFERRIGAQACVSRSAPPVAHRSPPDSTSGLSATSSLIPSDGAHSPSNFDVFLYLPTLSFFPIYLRLNLSVCIEIYMRMYITSNLMSQLVCPCFQSARTSGFLNENVRAKIGRGFRRDTTDRPTSALFFFFFWRRAPAIAFSSIAAVVKKSPCRSRGVPVGDRWPRILWIE
jgi:hypothetical protein